MKPLYENKTAKSSSWTSTQLTTLAEHPRNPAEAETMTEVGSVSSQLPPPGLTSSWKPSAMTTRPNWLERRCFEGNEKQFLLERSLRGVSLAQSRGNIQEEL